MCLEQGWGHKESRDFGEEMDQRRHFNDKQEFVTQMCGTTEGRMLNGTLRNFDFPFGCKGSGTVEEF